MVIPSRRTQILTLLIFLVSAVLRLGLVSFNRQSNDDHFAVIQLILDSNRLPEKADCWECYQPKLFHYTAAEFLRFTGLKNTSLGMKILAVELVNFIAGLITLLVIRSFLLRWTGKNETLSIFAFGLVALNPKLIGINSQATNDTFAILFSTLALFSTYEFLQKKRPITLLVSLFFIVLGISSKATGWITAIAILLALLIKAWTEKQLMAQVILVPCSFGLAILIISIFNPLNQYISNYRDYGAPILLNIEKPALPLFFKPTPVLRPGILSIQDGFFTFKFIDLLRHPRIETGSDYPPHLTSLWTQIYGRAYSIHFDNWPESWSTTGEQGFTLTRAIYILALMPSLLLLVGGVMEIILILKGIIKRDAFLASAAHYGLTVAIFIGYMLFIILYALEYRDFSVMKAIFIYPAMITFPLLFLRAGEALYARLTGRLRWVQAAIGAWIIILFILYSADIITMITLLTSRIHNL